MKPCITLPKPGAAGTPVTGAAGGGGLQQQVVALRLEPGLVREGRELDLAHELRRRLPGERHLHLAGRVDRDALRVRRHGDARRTG